MTTERSSGVVPAALWISNGIHERKGLDSNQHHRVSRPKCLTIRPPHRKVQGLVSIDTCTRPTDEPRKQDDPLQPLGNNEKSPLDLSRFSGLYVLHPSNMTGRKLECIHSTFNRVDALFYENVGRNKFG